MSRGVDDNVLRVDLWNSFKALQALAIDGVYAHDRDTESEMLAIVIEKFYRKRWGPWPPLVVSVQEQK